MIPIQINGRRKKQNIKQINRVKQKAIYYI